LRRPGILVCCKERNGRAVEDCSLVKEAVEGLVKFKDLANIGYTIVSNNASKVVWGIRIYAFEGTYRMQPQ
jgi:hypothetical protein